MKKSFIALLFVLFLVPTAFAADEDLFNDVDEDTQHFEAIEYVKDHGIVDGYDDGSYKPGDEINRAEFLKILMETKYQSEMESAVGSNCFDDVVGDEWYAKYVCYAKDLGIIVGYEDGTFRATDEISVVEALKVLLETMTDSWWRYYDDDQWEFYEIGSFDKRSDEAMEFVFANVPEDISDVKGRWYEQYIFPTAYYHLMLDDWFSFDQNITRGEMAEIVYRIDFLTEEEVSVNQPEDWEVIKEYVLSNYPISEEYFDEHFEYVKSDLNNTITDGNNYIGFGYWSIAISDLVLVRYNFVIDDTEEEEHVFENRFWLLDDQVIEKGYIHSSFYVPDGYEFNKSNTFAASSELQILITEEEAADIAKDEFQCIDPEWIDAETAERDLYLKAIYGEIYWMWEERLSHCWINAHTGNIDDIYQMLPY